MNHLKETLSDLKHRPVLYDLLPLVIIFLVVKLVVFLFERIVSFSGGGLRAPYQVSGESLNGLGLSGPVGQNDIVEAISAQRIDFDTAIFSAWTENLPLPEWVFFVSFICAWMTPSLYFVITILQKGGLTARRRTIAIGITSISGPIAAIGMLAGGYSVIRPDQFAGAFGGAIIYGAFLLHLFTDPKTRQRKWWPRIFGAFVFVHLVVINLISTGTFFSKSDPNIEKLNGIISNAYLSGWIEEAHFLLVSDASLIGPVSIGLLTPLIAYEFIKDKVIKRSPSLHMVLVVFYLALVGCIASILLGMIVLTPSTMTFGILSTIWLGMSIAGQLEKTLDQKNETKKYLDRIENWASVRLN